MNKFCTDNFDPQFLRLPLKLTPPDWDILDGLKGGDEFSEFDHFNSHYAREAECAEWGREAEKALLCANGNDNGAEKIGGRKKSGDKKVVENSIGDENNREERHNST